MRQPKIQSSQKFKADLIRFKGRAHIARGPFPLETVMSGKQLISFALIGLGLSIMSILTLDHWLAPKVIASESSRNRWVVITEMGDSFWMAILVILCWAFAYTIGKTQPTAKLWPELRQKAALVFAAVALPGLFVLVVKFFVGRPRPYTGELEFFPFTSGVDYASWPSGHTTTAFGFAVAVGLAFAGP